MPFVSIRKPRATAIVLAAAATALLVLLVLAFAPEALAGSGLKKLKIDVACDANTFVFEGPSTPAGPAYGASFVVQGVVYPGGTFEASGSTSGLLANGDPEFPELVIGRWTCRGWFIGDGMETATGPFVVTTQIYDLDPGEPGRKTIVSDGLELIDLDVPFERAITGGTGKYKKARGAVTQTAIGTNATGLFNFTFRFHK